MERTRDLTEIASLGKAFFTDGLPKAVANAIGDGSAYALKHTGGVVIFMPSAPKTYKMTVAFDDASRGLLAKEAINASIGWLFGNTDALTMLAYCALSNPASIAMAAHIYGNAITDGQDMKLLTVTRKRFEAARPKP